MGEEGYAFRREVGARVREMPELKEISTFFTDELRSQLEDSRSTTTAKLDAPLNKLARLLNSASIKRVLLNGSLRVDFDRVIERGEVLVVRGALGLMGAGNTSVLMQLLVGMLDAALARQQDLVPEGERVAVALKVDEAPLVLNRGFADTIALKRSAGLETLACWQTDSQWEEREVRDQLDALFAHRIYFATSSVDDARRAAALTMSEFSDSVRPGTPHLSALGRPDARLHLPRHHAIASLLTPDGRQPPFIAQTVPLQVDRRRIEHHLRRQHERGGRALEDLSQPHWRRRSDKAAPRPAPVPVAAAAPPPAPPAPVVAEVPRPKHSSQTVARDGGPSGAEPAGYAELVALDTAVTARRATPPARPVRLRPDAIDLEILRVLAGCGHSLTTQLHRHICPDRSPTTMQRRIKRLADAGLIERVQFHRADGGGAPMCCSLTAAGLQAARGAGPPASGVTAPRREPGGQAGAPAEIGAIRRQAHAAGWALAWCGLGDGQAVLLGREETTMSAGGGPRGRPFSPADLRLPDGRTPHAFLRTGEGPDRDEAPRFETIRPYVVVELPGWDLLVDIETALPSGSFVRKLERYDHFLTGWSLHTRRYRSGHDPRSAHVVIVCRDRVCARESARRADQVLCAARAYPGEPPGAWQYQGRERIWFAAERDVYLGEPRAWQVPRLPPPVRARHEGDPGASGARIEARALPLPADEPPRAEPGA